MKTCASGVCQFMTVGDAKALEYDAINSVSAVKSEQSPLAKALAPTQITMSESLRSLAAQKLVSIDKRKYQYIFCP